MLPILKGGLKLINYICIAYAMRIKKLIETIRGKFMIKQNMTIRIESKLKKDATDLFKSLGLDLTTATTMFYIQALQCHGLPFDVKIKEPNETTYKAIEDAEIKKESAKSFDNVDDLMESLDA